MPLASGSGGGDGGASMLVTMLKSMLHEYAQRRHSSHEVHGTDTLLRPGADGATTPRRYSEDAQHWIGNVLTNPCILLQPRAVSRVALRLRCAQL